MHVSPRAGASHSRHEKKVSRPLGHVWLQLSTASLFQQVGAVLGINVRLQNQVRIGCRSIEEGNIPVQSREDLRRDLKRPRQSPRPITNRWQTLAEVLADGRRKVGKIDAAPLGAHRSINFEGKVPLLRFSNYDTGLDDLFSTPPRAASKS